MPHIVAVQSALPTHYYTQSELLDGVLAIAAEKGQKLDVDRLRRFFSAVKVDGRRLALTLPSYGSLDGFETRNREWLRVALELGEQALVGALQRCALSPADLDLIASSTVTGLSVPS